MALKGNLRDFTVTQLLNLINLAHKTGSLVIEGPKQTAQVCFREGKLAYAQLDGHENHLAAILHRSRVLSAAQYRIIRERAGQVSDKELGLLLINAGYVTQQDVFNSLQAYFVSVLQGLFTWGEGFFHFENVLLVPEDKILVRVDLENLIIEGSRQLREWEQLQDEIPNLDMALKFTDRPGVNLRNINLSVEEWRVVSYINPKNTLNQIARTTKMTDLEIRRIAYSLLQAGLVELVRPVGAPPPLVSKPPLPVASKEEQISLVNRIIGRIRSL
jgi:hypothetical protein